MKWNRAKHCARKEINEMNKAFKIAIRDMVAEQKTADDLENCYFSDDEAIVITVPDFPNMKACK